MNQKIEKLKQERTVNKQKITQHQHQNERLESRIRYLTEGERKKRNHRLITRGAAAECVAPEVRPMSEAAFFDLVEAVFSLPEVKRLVQSATELEGG